MANNKLQPHRSINYRCLQFPKVSDRSIVSALELIFCLEIRLDYKILLPKHKMTTIAIDTYLQSAHQCQYVF